MEKSTFLEKLKKLVELAKGKHNALDVTEINNFFTGDDLSTEQMEQIYSYLENHGIDVIPVIDDNLLAEDPLLLDDDDDERFMKDSDEDDIDLDAIDLLEGIGTEDPVRMYLKRTVQSHFFPQMRRWSWRREKQKVTNRQKNA